MPFEKLIEASHLRYRWTGSATLDASWRFVELTNRRGQLFVRVDTRPWTYYLASGAAASLSEATNVLGRQSTAGRLIQEKIDATVATRRAPSHGNPYGRFPEGTEVGILGSYSEMAEVDFTRLTDGLGLRVLDEGFIEVYAGYPASFADEWDRTWHRISAPSEYRPWAIYVRTLEAALSVPSADAVRAAATTAGLPDIGPYPCHVTLDAEKLRVIGTLDRKTFDSQKKVMKNNSAAEVAALLGLRDVGWEWLHMVAFSLGGHVGNPQIPQNLVLGTASANTAMMLVEEFVKDEVARGHFTSATVAVSRTCPQASCGWFATSLQYMVKFDRGPGSAKYVRETFNPLQCDAPAFVVKQMQAQIKSFRSAPPPVPVSDTRRKPGGYRGRRL